MRLPSADIQGRVNQLGRATSAVLVLGSCVRFNICDPGAIWRSHNVQHAEDFDALFDLLARRPDVEMQFLCELE